MSEEYHHCPECNVKVYKSQVFCDACKNTTCPTCGKQFKRFANYRKHRLSAHPLQSVPAKVNGSKQK